MPVRNTKPYFIGVDIGTTSTKALAVDLSGKVLGSKQQGYPILTPQPHYAEQSPEAYFQAVLSTLRDLVKEVSGEGLVGIGFSCAMHGLMAMDASGKPLTNTLIWADNRSKDYAQELRKGLFAQLLYEQTGTPIHPMSPLCKIAWLRDFQSELFQKTDKFISAKEYVFLRLFGKYVVDYSVASAMGLMNIHRLCWDKEALAFAGIDTQQLSRLVPPTHYEQGLNKRLAEYLGIPVDIPFFIGGSDGCLANWGVGAIHTEETCLTIGTSGALRMFTNQPVIDPEGRTFCYAFDRNQYLVGGPINNGGIALQWFKKNFGINTEEEFQKLQNEATKLPAGAEGLLFLPYLLGERAPHWNANAKGVFFGMQYEHNPAHFLRAVFEGVSYGLKEIADLLESQQGKVKHIVANGGFTRSGLWLQIVANVFQCEVWVPGCAESSALGAAFIAMKGKGFLQSEKELQEKVKQQKKYLPDFTCQQVYQQEVDKYKRLYHKIKDEF
ncbi:gluconokinase [Rapidithrix thailandica]|uniref:Gluconokinase n=1 Tax=Rapidithrix thailandica TaxID=413964 RepID=A0AAW9S5M7_9BACT